MSVVPLGWLGIVRLGLVQSAIGAIVMLATSLLNRVMVVEYALPAALPAGLVAWHYAVQLSRPVWGHGSDRGARRTPWIIGGMAVLALGALLAVGALPLLAARAPGGLALAIAAFAMIGMGVGAAGTSLLALLATRVAPERRAAAAAITWIMMVAGIAVTAGIAGALLEPFSAARLTQVAAGVAACAFALAVVALLGVEGAAPSRALATRVEASRRGERSATLTAALRTIWDDGEARRFTLFVFVSMLAYAMQDLILEPFAGLVFGFAPGASTQLSGVQHGGVLVGMIVAGVGGGAFGGGRGEGGETRGLRWWIGGGCLGSAAALAGLALAARIGPGWPLTANVALLGLANGVFAVAAIGAMIALAGRGQAEGREQAGLRMGVWGAAQAIAFGLGGLLGATGVDLGRRRIDSPATVFTLVFLVEALVFVAAAALAMRRPGRQQDMTPVARARGGGMTTYDCVVVGGGPAGATAAAELAQAGRSVLLLDRAGRIKPCGGAIPPRLIRDFAIPDHLIVGRARTARMIAPSRRAVDMPVDPSGAGGYVGMVDRDTFDEWLRDRAAKQGAERRTGRFEAIVRDGDGGAQVRYTDGEGDHRVRARCVIGADGARSRVAEAVFDDAVRNPCVFAYHEVIRTPQPGTAAFDRTRCDVFYQAEFSPDFYGWLFPHGDTASIGVGSAHKGHGLRDATSRLRVRLGLESCVTLRREGAPIPLRPLRRWDNGRDVLVIGDAAGAVAPASGEGLYYAMLSARFAAEAVDTFLASGDPRALGAARRRFMRAHGLVFRILAIMQHFWYRDDRRRERFVAMCADRDVQHLTWHAYMNKRLIYARPLAYARIFVKDMRHLLQTAS